MRQNRKWPPKSDRLPRLHSTHCQPDEQALERCHLLAEVNGQVLSRVCCLRHLEMLFLSEHIRTLIKSLEPLLGPMKVVPEVSATSLLSSIHGKDHILFQEIKSHKSWKEIIQALLSGYSINRHPLNSRASLVAQQ